MSEKEYPAQEMFPLKFIGISKVVFTRSQEEKLISTKWFCCSYKVAAEQKARSTYEYLMEMTDDPDVITPLKFLREREVVHFQRFGEALRRVQDYMDSKRQFVMPKSDCHSNKKCKC